MGSEMCIRDRSRAKRADQPTGSRNEKRRQSPQLQLPRPRLSSHQAPDENLRANSFQQEENDENLMGLFNAQELDKKARKCLFDILLANIRGLRWRDSDDGT